MASSSLRKIHEDAMLDFDNIQMSQRPIREACLEDREFCSVPGGQWGGLWSKQFKNKPRVEVNKVHKSTLKISNDYRNNRMDVTFISKDGSPSDQLADTCAALYRSDKEDSGASEAFDNGFDEMVMGGIGGWRLSHKCDSEAYERYQDEQSDDDDEEPDENDFQRIGIEPIFDGDTSIYYDLDAKKQDKSDARACYVIWPLTIEEYKRRYPNDEPSSWDRDTYRWQYDWWTEDVVYIAEYYIVEEGEETVHIFKGPMDERQSYTEEELKDNFSLRRSLKMTGFKDIRKRKVKTRKIHKYLLNGMEVLEDCGYVAGTEIPVVIVYGKRIVVRNKEYAMGNVRLAKDAQRIKNVQLSNLVQASSSSPISKPIFFPEQMSGGRADEWADDNINNSAFLMVNPALDAAGVAAVNGPVGWTKPPEVAPVTAALIQLAEGDVKDILGTPEENDKQLSHVPGSSTKSLQQRQDMQTYVYVDNFAKGVKRTGEIWKGMAKVLYTKKGRKMKGLSQNGQMTQITLKRPSKDADGKPVLENDLTRASFDVKVSVGPSAMSQRDATKELLTGLMPFVQDPQAQQVFTHAVITNTEGEGLGDIRDWSHWNLLKMGVGKPTPEEAQKLQQDAQNAKPSAEDQLAMAEAGVEVAKAKKLGVDTQLTAAKIDKVKADVIKILADIDQAKQQLAFDTAEGLHGMLTTPMPPAPDQPNGPGSAT